MVTRLSYAGVLLRNDLVHVAVEHDVDVALQPDPHIVQLVCQGGAMDGCQEGLVDLGGVCCYHLWGGGELGLSFLSFLQFLSSDHGQQLLDDPAVLHHSLHVDRLAVGEQLVSNAVDWPVSGGEAGKGGRVR